MTLWNKVAKAIGVAAAGCLLFGSAATSARAAQRWDDEATWREVRNFDQFLGAHPDAAAEVWRHPNVVRKDRWCSHHPDFEEWASHHPRAAEQLRADPRGFMNRVRAWERHERGERPHQE